MRGALGSTGRSLGPPPRLYFADGAPQDALAPAPVGGERVEEADAVGHALGGAEVREHASQR